MRREWVRRDERKEDSFEELSHIICQTRDEVAPVLREAKANVKRERGGRGGGGDRRRR